MIIFLVISLVVSPVFVHAQDLGNQIEGTAKKVEGVIGLIENETAQEAYLKQEWTKLLAKTWMAQPLNFLDGVFTKLNPVWKILLGLEFSFSWIFVLTLLIWVLLLNTVFNMLGALEEISNRIVFIFGDAFIKKLVGLSNVHIPFFKKIAHGFPLVMKWILFVIFFIIISSPIVPFSSFISESISIRIPMLFAALILAFFLDKGPWWLQIISIILAIGILVFMGYVAKKITDVAKAKGRATFKEQFKVAKEEFISEMKEDLKKAKDKLRDGAKGTVKVVGDFREGVKMSKSSPRNKVSSSETEEELEDEEIEQEAKDALEGLGTD